jgi:hypothetical protein
VTRFKRKFNNSIEGIEMTKRIFEGLVRAVVPLSALGSNNDSVPAAALSAPRVAEVAPVIQHEL